MSKKVVLVTGGSGYIAGHVCKLLATTGLYNVRTTVRTKSPEKTAHLEKLGVEIFEHVDLLDSQSWNNATQGCDYVHHCASPFFFTTPNNDPQAGFVTPALEGTRNVIQAAINAKVQRVILTSSCAAITWANVLNHPKGSTHVWNEDDWQHDNTLQNGPYRLSKSVAEQEAWKLVTKNKQEPLELVTMCPSFVLGPVLSPRSDAASIVFQKNMFNGVTKKMTANSFGVVDVRDVAQAHVTAMTVDLNEPGLKNAQGQARFILSSPNSYPHIEIANTIRNAKDGLFGKKYPIPFESEGVPLQNVVYDNERSKHYLGMDFIGLEKSLVDGVESLEEFNILSSEPTTHHRSS